MQFVLIPKDWLGSVRFEGHETQKQDFDLCCSFSDRPLAVRRPLIWQHSYQRLPDLLNKNCFPLLRNLLLQMWREQHKYPSTGDWINKWWCSHAEEYSSAIKRTNYWYRNWPGWVSKTSCWAEVIKCKIPFICFHSYEV